MRYCSADAQKGYEQSRKDDMISLAHVLIYFLMGGKLPWMDTNDKREQIKKKYEWISYHLRTFIVTQGSINVNISQRLNYCRFQIEFEMKEIKHKDLI